VDLDVLNRDRLCVRHYRRDLGLYLRLNADAQIRKKSQRHHHRQFSVHHATSLETTQLYSVDFWTDK
jgi:hypothetical protein